MAYTKEITDRAKTSIGIPKTERRTFESFFIKKYPFNYIGQLNNKNADKCMIEIKTIKKIN